jgi:tripartite-type tricarboxylate transporter receptor subunit TctC
MKALTHALTAVALAVASNAAFAQAYPNKPIRLVVPFAPGGTTDIIARAVNDALGKELGQPVLVENRAGGGGSVGADAVAKAAPDGYTLGVATVSTMATNPATNPKNPYNPLTDFVPITNFVTVPNVMTCNPNKIQAKDMKALIAQFKSAPGKHSYASSGVGGISHLDGELFKQLTGTFIVHIPYRGSGPALTDTLAGQVDCQLDNLPSSLPHIRANRLRAYAVANAKRVDGLNDIPTFAELGLAPMNNMAWYGLIAPKGTPQAIIDRLHAAAVKVVNDPAVRKRLIDSGSNPDGNSPQQFAAQIKREFDLRKKTADDRKIVLE